MAEKIIVDLNVETAEAIKGVNNTTKSVDKLNKEVAQSKKVSKDASKGMKLLSKGLKGVGVAMKAAGIGIVVAILGSLFEIMRKNQVVLDALETATNFIAVAFKAVTDALTTAYNSVSETTGGFDALKTVVINLIKIGLTPLKLTFLSLKSAALGLKVAYESMFGDEESVKKAKADLEETRLEMVKVTAEAVKSAIAVKDNIGEAIDEVGTGFTAVTKELGKIEPAKLLKAAQNMTVLGKASAIAAAQQQGLVEKYDRLAEQQRQLRDDESLSIEKRKKANDELLVQLRLQEEAMLREAKIQITNAEAQVAANGNDENKIALIEAQNNKLAVLAQIEGFISEQKVNAIALDKEALALSQSKLESDANLSIERKRFNAEQIEDDLLRLEKQKEIDLEEAELQSKRLQANIDAAGAGTQAETDAIIALDMFKEQSRQQNITRDKEIADEQAKINATNNKNEKKWAELTAKDKGKIALDGLNTLSDVLGKQSALGKAAAIANATISTYESATSAYKSLAGIPIVGPVLGGIAAGAAVVAGFKNVKSILATKVPGGGGGGSAPSTPNVPSTPSTPQVPNFNVVGSSDTNQLADAIGGQSSQPVRAYVVSGEVSTAQSLDRNIIDDASIG